MNQTLAQKFIEWAAQNPIGQALLIGAGFAVTVGVLIILYSLKTAKVKEAKGDQLPVLNTVLDIQAIREKVTIIDENVKTIKEHIVKGGKK